MLAWEDGADGEGERGDRSGGVLAPHPQQAGQALRGSQLRSFLSFCLGVCCWELLSKAKASAEVPALGSLPFYSVCL